MFMDVMIHRPRLTEWEAATLLGLLNTDLKYERRNIKCQRQRINNGELESRIFPLSEQQKYLRKKYRLRNKLVKCLPKDNKV